MFKIIDNPNTKLKEEAEKRLNEMYQKYGKKYCPCVIKKDKDTICPCKLFREQDYEGECHCGRYYKINI